MDRTLALQEWRGELLTNGSAVIVTRDARSGATRFAVALEPQGDTLAPEFGLAIRLMAAAPQLLFACSRLLEFAENPDWGPDDLDAIATLARDATRAATDS